MEKIYVEQIDQNNAIDDLITTNHRLLLTLRVMRRAIGIHNFPEDCVVDINYSYLPPECPICAAIGLYNDVIHNLL